MTTWERYQAIYREQQEQERRRAEREEQARIAAETRALGEIYATVAALLGPLVSDWAVEPLPECNEWRHNDHACVVHLVRTFEHPGPQPLVPHGGW